MVGTGAAMQTYMEHCIQTHFLLWCLANALCALPVYCHWLPLLPSRLALSTQAGTRKAMSAAFGQEPKPVCAELSKLIAKARQARLVELK